MRRFASQAIRTGMSVEKSIISKLTVSFAPTVLEVVNASFKHNVPTGSETHFKVLVVSPLFTDKSLIQKHRLVNACLADELKEGVHALSIQALTPEQWAVDNSVKSTPPCLGGGAKSASL